MEHVQKLLAQANDYNKLQQQHQQQQPYQHQPMVVQQQRYQPDSHQNGNNPTRRVTMQRVKELGISFINPAVGVPPPFNTNQM